MIKRTVCFRAACILGAVGWTAQAAQAQDTTPVQNPVVAALGSKEPAEREKAAQQLLRDYALVRNDLLNQLGFEMRNLDTTFEGPFPQLLEVLGRLRIALAVEPLSSLIEMRLTGRQRAGGFGGPSTYYPVATTIVDIGGPKVAESIFRLMTQPAQEDRIRVSTWVLVETYSKPVASSMIQVGLDDLSARMKINGGAPSIQMRNLQRMKQLLESNEPIIRDPAIPLAPQPGNANAAQPVVPLGAGVVRD